MNRYILLLGSNLGDRDRALSDARRHIARRVGRILAESPVLSTAPVGEGVTGEFLNQALMVESALDPERTLAAVESIERRMGRDKPLSCDWNAADRTFSDRIMDIDIAFADFDGGGCFEGRWNSPKLAIPHRAVRERGFIREIVSSLQPAPSSDWNGTVAGLFREK